MKLFGRTGGYYLFWTGFVYFWTGTYLAFTHSGYTEYATLAWAVVLLLPIVCRPVGRHFNMRGLEMFDWFNKPDYKAPDNVYNLPKPKAVPQVPYVEPPTREQVVYKVGKTEDGKVTLSLGDYSGVVITMNNAGVDHLIRMLEAAKDIGDH